MIAAVLAAAARRRTPAHLTFTLLQTLTGSTQAHRNAPIAVAAPDGAETLFLAIAWSGTSINRYPGEMMLDGASMMLDATSVPVPAGDTNFAGVAFFRAPVTPGAHEITQGWNSATTSKDYAIAIYTAPTAVTPAVKGVYGNVGMTTQIDAPTPMPGLAAAWRLDTAEQVPGIALDVSYAGAVVGELSQSHTQWESRAIFGFVSYVRGDEPAAEIPPMPITLDHTPTVVSTGSGGPVLHETVVPMPAPLGSASSHQAFSHIVNLGGGHLYAIYRTASGHSNLTALTAGHGIIVGARSVNYGATWTLEAISDDPDMWDDRDPSLTWVDHLNCWVLTYPTWDGTGTGQTVPTGCLLHYRTNPDPNLDPAQWSTRQRILPTDIPALSEYLATTSPFLVAADGSLVIPATGRLLAGQTQYCALMLRSSSGTMAGPWVTTVIGNGPADGRSYDEPYARKLRDGTYLAMSRFGGGTGRYTSLDGITWSPGVINATVGSGRPGWMELASGVILLGVRTGPTPDQNRLYFSRDRCETWEPYTIIPPTGGRGTYLAFIEVAPNLVGVLYSLEYGLNDGRMYFRYVLDGQLA